MTIRMSKIEPLDIAAAWHSVTDTWVVRRNKAHGDGKQWEVVHDWGGGVLDDNTQKVMGRFDGMHEAHELAEKLENAARGVAVLRLFEGGEPPAELTDRERFIWQLGFNASGAADNGGSEA